MKNIEVTLDIKLIKQLEPLITAKSKFCANTPVNKSDRLNIKINLHGAKESCFVLINMYMTNEFAIIFPTIIITLITVSVILCQVIK